MINHTNLPTILGSKYNPDSRYVMVETNSSGRSGKLPAPRTAMAGRRQVKLDGEGTWQSLGNFSDPEVTSTRQFTTYQWMPKSIQPELPAPTKES